MTLTLGHHPPSQKHWKEKRCVTLLCFAQSSPSPNHHHHHSSTLFTILFLYMFSLSCPIIGGKGLGKSGEKYNGVGFS